MKRRLINTKFWSDNFIVELDPLERYLFLYLLTNEHTEICGVYELPLKVMSRETGIENEMLLNIIKRFGTKISYIDGWVFILNFTKNQCANENMKTGAEKSLLLVPKEIMAKYEAKQNTLKPSETLTQPSEISELKLESKLEPESEPKPELITEQSSDGQRINFILNVFKKINPVINFGQKTYRTILEDFIKQFGYEKTLNMVNYAVSIQGSQYAPTITNPYQLKIKMGDLNIYYEKSKAPIKGAITFLD